MYSDVRIVNWLVTRKCNLRCSLCAIRRDNVSDEMSFDDIEHRLKQIEDKCDHPFHIVYGGEPFIRSDIEKIIALFQEVCPDRWTIYHNATMVSDVVKLAKKYRLTRITASIDPVKKDKYRLLRAQRGYELLKILDGIVPDRVATITVDKQNYTDLVDTVEMLSQSRIVSNITTFDPPGSEAYDFSVPDTRIIEALTVYPHHVRFPFDAIRKGVRSSKMFVHYVELLDIIEKSLPRNYRCQKPWSSLTIDSDGSIRLCLRIGIHYNFRYFVDQPDLLRDMMKHSQNTNCNGCVWTCIMMSEMMLDVRQHTR